jgi:hypothetical protein
MRKTFIQIIKESSEFARAGTAARKKASMSHPGVLPDSFHKHIEALIDAAREEGRNYGSQKHSDKTDYHHDRLVNHLHKHFAR